VLRNSDIWDIAQDHCEGVHIITDGAYPTQKWLLTPYRDSGRLTPNEKRYNRLLSSNRVTIERTFGLLKGRFKWLQLLFTNEVETALKIIMPYCVFHNICILNLKSVHEFMDVDDCREQNAPLILQGNVHQNEGVIKRALITRTLPQ
jgi:hypothetical protein